LMRGPRGQADRDRQARIIAKHLGP
jgi:hypothetical protein